MIALVVDDEPWILDIWEQILVSSGYEVVTADNGQSGVDQLRRQHVDVVITDLKMPVADGFAMLELLATEAFAHIPCFVCSGYLDDSVELTAYRVTRVIDKPFKVANELDYFSRLAVELDARRQA